ncbi:MAG TPA: hypothetical protein HPQ04_08075 [Rhodospirillaceae bacterium]|nr:hypothetical protein [Rhodospirillaceae bacterium]
MTAVSHPPDDLLMAYGAGSLDELTAVLVATHLSLCPHCCAEVALVEAMGGALLEDLAPAEMADNALAAILKRLDEPAPRRVPVAPARSDRLPGPLSDYLPGGLQALAWKRLGRGIEQVVLLRRDAAKLRLLRIGAGVAVPAHGHRGTELTLVLRGGFTDLGRHYGPGDVAGADVATVHSPAADDGEACLCLAVTDAPLRLTGMLGRLINPFLDL